MYTQYAARSSVPQSSAPSAIPRFRIQKAPWLTTRGLFSITFYVLLFTPHSTATTSGWAVPT